MVNKELLEKFAKQIAYKGVNVQKGQIIAIRTDIAQYEFANLVTKYCYEAGARKVTIEYIDNEKKRLDYTNVSLDDLTDVPNWLIEKSHNLVDSGYARISLVAPDPHGLAGIDPSIIQKVLVATNTHLDFVRDYSMNNVGQWNVVNIPNKAWAKEVFPDLDPEEGLNKLWELVFKACRISLDSDPLVVWEEHSKRLAYLSGKLNSYDFKELRFKNSLGTDLSVGLSEDHVFAGGAEIAKNGVEFSPNIPTEEVFGQPSKYKVNGTVIATKPLNYQDTLIKDFGFTFKDGAVVDYFAKEGLDMLKSLVEFDAGSKYLGEVALISHDSPISNMNVLFYSTLFDENASCHLALGQAYAMNIKNGTSMTKEELMARGANSSKTHVDFMFGSSDMSVKGVTKAGEEIDLFVDGNFVI